MMAELLLNPTVLEIKRASRAQLVELAKHQKVDIGEESPLREIRAKLIATLGVVEDRESEMNSVVPSEVGDTLGEPVVLDIYGGNYTFEQVLQLKQIEQARLEKDREFEREKLELERMKAKMEYELKMREIELAGDSHQFRNGSRESNGFRVNDCYRSLPQFEETDVERFFQQFERVASELKWPQEYWTILVQSKFVGKAASVYNSLNDTEVKEYVGLKDAILRAYQLTSEAYRQKFRNVRRSESENYCEFATRKENLFEKWARAEEVDNNFQKLKELIILEEFKNCLPLNVRIHLEDQKVSALREASIAADKYILIHKSQGHQNDVEKSRVNGNGKFIPFHKHNSLPFAKRGVSAKVNSSKEIRPAKPFRDKFELPHCSYCGKNNHIIANCFARKRDNEKVVGFVHCQNPPTHELKQIKNQISQRMFTSQARIFGVDQDEQASRAVSIYRDTGAGQSLVTQAAIDNIPNTATNQRVVIKSVCGNYQTLPLHRCNMKSDFVNGEVLLAVIDKLPINGIEILLGNDLTDSCCTHNNRKVMQVCDHPLTECLGDTDDKLAFPACVTTRSMTRKVKEEPEEIGLSDSYLSGILRGDVEFASELDSETQASENDNSRLGLGENRPDGQNNFPQVSWSKKNLCKAQREDETLKDIWDKITHLNEVNKKEECFYVENEVLMRKSRKFENEESEISVRRQVVVPKIFRNEILSLGHESLFAGHQGRTKTYERVVADFFWPRMFRDTEEYCRTCHVCQVTGKPNQTIPPAPLKLVPITGEAFSKVLMDIVGPLPKTSNGNQYLLTIMCVNTRFPEAIPLRKVTAAVVAKALLKYFTMTGLPQEIQTDQGSNFMSKLCQQVLALLDIKQVRSSAFHPASLGALERFHQHLKSMLRCFCKERERDWDQVVHFALFAARDAKQESLGFSPFELVYGHTPRGPLKLVKDSWLQENSSDELLDYVARIKDRLWQATELAKKHLLGAQSRIKGQFDRKAKVREFRPGDKVLLYLPIPKSSLQSKYFGPYTVNRKVSDTGYIIDTPDRCRKTRYCHINLLKAYYDRSTCSPVLTVETEEIGAQICESEVRLNNSDILANLDTKLHNLPTDKRNDMKQLIQEFSVLFPDAPTVTNAVTMDVDVGSASPVKQHPYRMNPRKRDTLKTEIDYMLKNNIIEPSDSNWSSPCILVPKPDGTFRMCADLRKVNQFIKDDNYPLPRIDDCIDKIGPAKFITKIDLLKGYWQVPLTDRAKRVLAIVTPDGLYQFRVAPFGVKTAPAVFQRLMNKLLGDLSGVEVYLDDCIVGNDEWREHLSLLRQVFTRLMSANLTVNLSKCEFGQAQVVCLGHVVGLGKVLPILSKVECIKAFPQPKTRKEVRRFLGMAGFYRRFCPNFATIAAPITDLLKKGNKFVWSEACRQSCQLLKDLLCTTPVLAAPRFSKPFKLAVDASNLASGAVLFQEDDDGIDHPVSYFSKKFDRHQSNYSVIEKEALGLIQALKHFEIYVKSCAHTCVVYTDHNPLTFIHRVKHSNQRVLRWSLFLQDYPITIQHIAGSANIIADALSRAV